MREDDPVMWNLVAEISQGLQMSFASIKAAISSLLDSDIFWDQATQHEFMQTIDHSVDELSNLTAVMTVAMRLKNQALPIHREPSSLQEILSRAKDHVQQQMPETPILLALPVETRLALVDFDYLLMALRLLIEVLISTRDNPSAPLSVQMLEDAKGWQIMFDGQFSGLASDIVNWFCHASPEQVLPPANLRTETRLKALTSYQLFALHAISMATNSTGGASAAGDNAVRDSAVLALYVPFEIEA